MVCDEVTKLVIGREVDVIRRCNSEPNGSVEVNDMREQTGVAKCCELSVNKFAVSSELFCPVGVHKETASFVAINARVQSPWVRMDFDV